MNALIESLGLNGGVLLAQVVNILLLIFAFKIFLGDAIIKEITQKRALIAKLENADQAYDEIIDKANQEAIKITAEGKAKKDALIAEAGSIGEKRKEELIKEGHLKAETIISDAETKASLMQKEMEDGFEEAVKTVSLTAINKIFDKDKKLKDEYVDTIIKDVKET